MGKGDKKTRRGKIWRGSFGNTRPHKLKNNLLEAGANGSAEKPTTASKKLKSPKGGDRVVRKVSRKPKEAATSPTLEAVVPVVDSSVAAESTPTKAKKTTAPKAAPAAKKPKTSAPKKKSEAEDIAPTAEG